MRRGGNPRQSRVAPNHAAFPSLQRNYGKFAASLNPAEAVDHSGELAACESVDVRNVPAADERAQIFLLEQRPFDADAPGRIRSVEDDEFNSRLAARLHREAHRADKRIG